MRITSLLVRDHLATGPTSSGIYAPISGYLLAAVTLLLVLPRGMSEPLEAHACFGQIFEITCAESEHIVFDSAHYGKNNRQVAALCHSMYERTCDFDVHFTLNRKCAGMRRCSLAVNTKLFRDPCGYEEFLVARYSCVPDTHISSICSDLAPPLFAPGFVSSPSYPDQYFRSGDCTWQLEVQKRQTIIITLLDFELDVSKGGMCRDYLQISAGERVYFKDCGAQGRAEYHVDSNRALVHFHSDQNSLTQRGFLLKFRAEGPGCPDHSDLIHGQVVHFMQGDTLYANITCDHGYVQAGTSLDFIQVKCSGNHWSGAVHPCEAPPPLTTPKAVSLTSAPPSNSNFITTPIAVALGLFATLLLILLTIILALYCSRRRRRSQICKDEWRFVVNNLQDNELNEDVYKYRYDDIMDKRNNKDTPSRNLLLSTPIYCEETGLYTPGVHTPVRGEPLYVKSMSSPPKNSIGKRSKERLFDESLCSECANNMMRQECPLSVPRHESCSPPRPTPTARRLHSQKDLRSQRRPTKTPSPEDTRTCKFPNDTNQCLTQSAPDLMQLAQPAPAFRPSTTAAAATFYVPSGKTQNEKRAIPVPPPKPKPLPKL